MSVAARAVVIKTIRADAGINDTGESDAAGRRVLIVHLVRDPRAVIHSQIKTFNVAHKYRRYFPPPAEMEHTPPADPTVDRSLQHSMEGGHPPNHIYSDIGSASSRCTLHGLTQINL